jgi:hypothetical protein
MEGHIYQVQEDFLDRFLSRTEYDQSGLNPKYDIIKDYGKIEAMWTKYVKINDKIYWRMMKECPPKVCETDRKLPSDSIYRQDSLYWNLKDPY